MEMYTHPTVPKFKYAYEFGMNSKLFISVLISV